MAKNSKDVYGATSKTNVLNFEPEKLKLIIEPKHELFDKRVLDELDPNFVASIDHFGILEPIIVRKNTETGDIEVVAGRQRVKAAIEVNKARKKKGEPRMLVPATFKRTDDVTLMGIMAVENEGRKGTTVMQRAELMQRMLARGATEEQCGKAFLISPASVRNTIALLEAPADVRKAVEKGEITASNGFKLARMPVAEAREKLAEVRNVAPRTPGRRNGSGTRAREIIEGAKRRPRAKAAGDARDEVAGTEATIYLRQIAAMQETVQENLHIAGEFKRQIIACLKALQGDPVEWNEILVGGGP